MNRASKLLHRSRRRMLGRRPDDAATVLIVGCQRSGTSLLLRLIERDWRAHVYGEKSRLFEDRPGDRRMIALAEAVALVQATRARVVAVKPLVESHRVPELLSAFPSATAIWMLRDVRDVALSNLAAFGTDNGRIDMQPILSRSVDDWRSAGASTATLDRAAELAAVVTSPVEWAAVFWFVRNSLFFDLDYQGNESIATCTYDDLVRRPTDVVRALYCRAGQAFPGDWVTAEVSDGSLGRGSDVWLHADIETACAELWTRLSVVDETRALWRMRSSS